MKKSLLFLFGFFATPFLFSQILTVNSGSSVSIASGSSITLDGLEIAPDDTYVISGANGVARSVNAVTSGANSSVSRVYSASDLLSGFTGTLSFSYLEAELNGIAEGDLVLELWYLSNPDAVNSNGVVNIISEKEVTVSISYSMFPMLKSAT